MPHVSTSSRGLLLSQVIPDGQWYGGDEVQISSCCVEPDRCQPGDLFVALHDLPHGAQPAVDTALRRGAGAILSERIFPRPVPQFLVDDCRAAYGHLCHALLGNPAGSLRTVGITGSYGKTVTEQLLVGIFRAAGYHAAALESLSDENRSNARLAAGAPSAAAHLATWLAELRGRGGTHAVIEAPSQALAERRLSGISLDAAVITNVAREHVRWHGSLQNYQAAKASLLKHLKPGGFAVLNADDPTCSSLIAQLDAPVITVGLQQPADITATVIERHASEQTFLLETGDESHVVRTHIIGDGHMSNCLVAAAVGLVMGIRPADIIRGLESVQSLAGRLQRVECGQPFSVFIDRSHSPSGLARLLTTLRQVCKGRLHCLSGIDSRLSASRRAQVGRVMERWADRSVLTGSRLNRKLPMKMAHEVLDGYDRPAQAQLMPSRSRAICWALSQAAPGDVVLLSGGRESLGPDDVLLTDEDVTRYWLQHVDQREACPWTPV